jgi:cytochrome b561
MPSVYDLRIHLLLSLIQLGVSIWGIVIFITSAKRFNAYYYQKLQQALEQPNPAECKESCGTTHLYYLLLIGLYIAYVFLVSGLGNALH